jgi:hypothetical protein
VNHVQHHDSHPECSSRDSMYCPADCRALSSNNGISSRSATRVTDVLKLARVPLSLVATLATLPSISEIPFLDCLFCHYIAKNSLLQFLLRVISEGRGGVGLIGIREWSEWDERHGR